MATHPYANECSYLTGRMWPKCQLTPKHQSAIINTARIILGTAMNVVSSTLSMTCERLRERRLLTIVMCTYRPSLNADTRHTIDTACTTYRHINVSAPRIDTKFLHAMPRRY